MELNGTVMLTIVKGILADLSEEDQAKVKECKERLSQIVQENGQLGLVALTYLSVEEQIRAGK